MSKTPPEAPRLPSAPEIPEDLETRLYDVLLNLPRAEQEQALVTLYSKHRSYASLLRSLVIEFRSGERALAATQASIGDLDEPTKVGPYHVISRLGEGGFGVVYLAEQHEPIRRHVALKLILPGMDSRRVLARFEAERQALAMMDHAYIAKVFDAGVTEDHQPFFAMEHVPGVSVTQFCDDQDLSIGGRLELFIKICEGVQHAHQKGIVHRDLKPSNVLVIDPEGEPVPKIIDFGVAKAMDERLTDSSMETVAGHIVGTPSYMSPEQADSSVLDIDTRTDIYSLGVLLYELLVGKRPFDSSSSHAERQGDVLRMIREIEPQRPSHASASVPRDLDWVVLKALAKNREDRYPTVAELAADLRRFLAHEPVLAGPPTVTYRMRKFVRRYRTQVAAASIVLIALVTVLVSTIWALIEVDHARSQAVARGDELDLARDRAESLAYAANLAAAKAALDSGNAEAASRRLQLAPARLRGWEHDYLVAQCDHSLVVYAETGAQTDAIRDSGRGVRDIVSTRDGDHLVATGYDGRIEIWDVQRGEICAKVNGDGQHRLVALHPDLPQFATASETGRVELWDLPSGAPRQVLAEGESLYSIAYSCKGQLAYGTESGVIRVLQANSDRVAFELRGHETNVTSLDYLQDGTVLASSDAGGRVNLWSTAERRVVRELTPSVEAGAYCVRISPDGKQVAVAGRNGSVAVWTRENGKPLWKVDSGVVMLRLEFTADSATLLGVGGYGRSLVAAWDAHGGEQVARWSGHGLGVEALALAPAGERFFTGSRDGTIRGWSLRAPRAVTVHHSKTGHLSCDIHPRTGVIATGTSEGKLVVREAGFGPVRWTHETETDIRGLAFHPTDSRLFTIGLHGRLEVRDAETGKVLRHVSLEQETPFKAITVDRHGERIALTDWRGVVLLFETGTLENTFRLPPGGEETAVAFHPHQDVLAVCGSKGDVRFLDAGDGSVVGNFEIGKPTFDCRFSPDGSLIACTGSDGAVRLIEFESRRLRHEMRAGGSTIFGCAFMRNGERIATTNMDGTVRIWDVESGLELLALDGRASRLGFDPSGNHLYGSASTWHSKDASFSIWSAPRTPR